MNDLRILIIEDNPSIALDEEMLIDEMGYETIGVADNGEDALLRIHEDRPDLILMDIQLKGKLTGLDIARQIRHLKIPIIFTTSFNDRSRFEESRDTFSFGYLVKPFDKLSLQSAIEMALRSLGMEERLQAEEEPEVDKTVTESHFMVRQNGMLQRVLVKDILYISVEGNYTTLHTEDRRFVVKTSLRKVFEGLDPERFMWIHKSYVIQLDRIRSIDTSSHLVKIGKFTLPLGRNYKNEVLDRFSRIQ